MFVDFRLQVAVSFDGSVSGSYFQAIRDHKAGPTAQLELPVLE